MRLVAQLPALLLLTVLCGVNVSQEDEGEFDRFLMATAKCKTSGTKLSRVSCIIEQVSSPCSVKEHITSFQVAGGLVRDGQVHTISDGSTLGIDHRLVEKSW